MTSGSDSIQALLDVEFVVTVHDEIIAEIGGLSGFAGAGKGGVEAALTRINHHILYDNVDDVFLIAAFYAAVIAQGHVFNDGNKRTGLTCALTYLDKQGFRIPKTQALEDIMVDLAQGQITSDHMANVLALLSLNDGIGE